MKRQDAVKILAKAGKTKDVLDLIGVHAARSAEEYADVRADGTRTEEWRRWKTAQIANQHFDQLNDTLSSMATGARTSDQGDAARVFGTAGLAGDSASLTISMRDAADRVAQVAQNSPNDLRDLLARATRSGDEVLARAIAQHATEAQSASLMEQFLDDRPALKAAGTRLWDAERASQNTMGVTMALMALLPDGFETFEGVEWAAMEPEPGAPAVADSGPRGTFAHTTSGLGSIFGAYGDQ